MKKEKLIKLAKSHLKEFIYFQAMLDNRNVTFPQTELILQNYNLENVDEDDVIMINDLKKAFKYMLQNVDEPLTLKEVIKINELVAVNEALFVGKLRDTTIGIGGVEKKRPPLSENIFYQISKKDFSKVEECVDLFLEMCTLQFFYDGNKRTSSLVLNKLLIQNEHGYFSIYSENLEKFSTLLNNYYNEIENSKDKIRDFIISQCIHYKVEELEQNILDNIDDVDFSI